ncbi:hypothetical protein ARALYDRAFT_891359 [Arabidopsis lyrata subsp. lyrata]|uniref:Polycomb protein VEFS-Box domain-containing protein n=1 Tax=Arabidopsis lyrata subsp. lyrata TaxID=81972 RepID=D7KNN9_ARALL|nr:hypothetical protein ARALYDRAFT_891359 [Arabidopsis lyrata subsp. lyrata]
MEILNLSYLTPKELYLSLKSRIPPGKHYERNGGAESNQRVPPADVQSCGDPDSVQTIAGSTMLQFAKTNKLSIQLEQMLDDFVDVTKDEKQMMHMWNSFVRKQRCWRVFMVKL